MSASTPSVGSRLRDRGFVVAVAASVTTLGAVVALLAKVSDVLADHWPLLAGAAVASVAYESLAYLGRPAQKVSGAPGGRLVRPMSDDQPREVPERPIEMRVEGWTLPKSSSTSTGCEDSFAADPESAVVAISDGASSAFLSAEWSRVLTRSYVDERPGHNLDVLRAWVRAAGEQWDVVAATQDDDGPSWISDEMADRGSYATFLGARVIESGEDSLRWKAVAVGDSCVVQLRQLEDRWMTVCAFPLDCSAAFSNHPDLVATTTVEALPRLRTIEGELHAGDVLLLMTDALAQWAFARHESGASEWDSLVSCPGLEELQQLVDLARSTSDMVDDDVALARITAV